MYWKLAIQNIRRSLRDYIIYFVTLTLIALCDVLLFRDRSRKAHKWLYFPLQAYPCGFLFPAPVRHPTQLSTTYRQFGVKVV